MRQVIAEIKFFSTKEFHFADVKLYSETKLISEALLIIMTKTRLSRERQEQLSKNDAQLLKKDLTLSIT